jgi:hypothetical protein
MPLPRWWPHGYDSLAISRPPASAGYRGGHAAEVTFLAPESVSACAHWTKAHQQPKLPGYDFDSNKQR